MRRALGFCVAIALASVLGCGGGGPDCNNACAAAGATQCSGTQVQTCTADAKGCLSLTPAVACGAGLFCNGATNACGACVNTCSKAGIRQCSGTQVQTCTADANGCLAPAAPAACPTGQVCDAVFSQCVGVPVTCARTPVVRASAINPPDPGTAGPCLRPLVTSTLPVGTVAGTAQALGTHTVGDIVPFNIPAGTGGFSIVSQGVNAQTTDITVISPGGNFTLPNSVVPEIVHEPNGSVFYSDLVNPPADPSAALAAYGGISPSTGAFTVPNTTAALQAFATGVPTGTWNFKVGDFAQECAELGPTQCIDGSTTSTYDITVLTRPTVGAIGTVDVGIYLVTNNFGTAASAVTNAGMTRMLSTLQALYGRAGLCLGTVTFYDVPDWVKTRYATGVSADATGPCDDLDQMFTLSSPANELSFFFVDDIAQQAGAPPGGPSVVGIDGTIPGPSSFGGTLHSGAVVNASNIGLGAANCGSSLAFTRCGSDLTAYIAAHEGGHFMGLYHTTESIGAFFDPVADTGQCSCPVCAPAASQSKCFQNSPTLPPGQAPTQVFGSDCNTVTCEGAQYLMFWIIDNNSVGNVSAQQAQIVRANPVVR